MMAKLPRKKRFQSSKVIVLGDIMLDEYLLCKIDRISPEAPVPVGLVNERLQKLGGAANVAFNLKKLGLDVTLVSIVGNDAPAKILSKLLKKEGISSHIVQAPEVITPIKTRVISRYQQLIRLDQENCMAGFRSSELTEVLSKIANKHNFVIFSDYNKGCLADIKFMIDICKKVGLMIFVDPKSKDFSKYSGAHFVTPNESELKEALGYSDWNEELKSATIKLLKDHNINGVLCTRAEKGATLFESGRVVNVDPVNANLFDVTGAGDTVISVFAACIYSGSSVVEAAKCSMVAAGTTIRKMGTTAITYDELLEQLGASR